MIEDSPGYSKDNPGPIPVTYGSVSTIAPQSIYSYSVNAMYGEGSAEGKRARIEDPRAPVPVLPAQTLPPVPMVLPGVANLLNPNAVGQSQPLPTYPGMLPQQVARPKKKGVKRVGKKTEPQPLVGMFNPMTNVYDKPVSIRQLLRENKVDLNWLDWLAWCPDVC